MAQALGQRILSDVPGGVTVSSGGLSAYGGQPASSHAQFLVSQSGGDLGAHEARPLTREIVEAADIVLTMTEGHRREIERAFPAVSHKVFALAAFAGESDGADVADPFGGNLAAYENAYQQIERLVRASEPRLRKLAAKRGPAEREQ